MSDDKRWLQRHVRDPFVKSAQQDGFRSRAAYKLQEILAKHIQLKNDMAVLDIGSAPGGWSQVLAETLAGRGRIIALDRLPMKEITGVEFVQGDFTEQETLNDLLNLTENKKFDWIFSDLAPNMSGIKSRDQAECAYLMELVIDLGNKVLKDGGGILMKVFQGREFNTIREQLKSQYQNVRIIKPKASRDSSSEVYLLASGYNL